MIMIQLLINESSSVIEKHSQRYKSYYHEQTTK